ncbi:hypothetical protein THAOC_28077, partial [Thalassiosira oceanica]
LLLLTAARSDISRGDLDINFHLDWNAGSNNSHCALPGMEDDEGIGRHDVLTVLRFSCPSHNTRVEEKSMLRLNSVLR